MQAPAASPNDTLAPTQLFWSGMTHRGRVRANNEDAFLALTFDGHHVNYLGKIGEAPLTDMDFVFAVSDGMGATLSLCWFSPGWVYFGHIGDSRIYYLPKTGPMVQITHDHSHVGWLRRKGQLNEREARTHPQRSSLNQVLGAGNQFIEPQIGAVDCQNGDRFLICSDGLIDGIWDRRLDEILRATPSAHDLARLLVEESVAESGRDNTTAVVVDVRTSGAKGV